MPTSAITVPDAEHELVQAWLAADPEPSRCDKPGHGDCEKHYRDCEPCAQYRLWRKRINARYHRHGLRRNPRPAEDPQPVCPDGHRDARRHAKSCEPCRQYVAWRARQYRRQHRTGVPLRYTDVQRLASHIETLEAAGMVLSDIAKAVGVKYDTLWSLRAGQHRFMLTAHAEKLLAVQPPAAPVSLVRNARGDLRRLVDATGTRRRIRCAQRAGHPIHAQAARYGWAPGTVHGWLECDTVTVDVAARVADIFSTLIRHPGGCRQTTKQAECKGWPEARYFSATNIDDPSYDPFEIISKPYGVYRRLRALAWDGQGPEEVAEWIGEAPEQVEIWMEGGPAPAYASHMVAAAYEALAGREGPDQRAADRARHMDWAPWPAWEGVDIDYRYARPCYDLPPGVRKTDHPLDSQVWLALMGRVSKEELLHEERVQAVRFLHRLGWSDRRIAAWLRWNPEGDLDKGLDAVMRFRARNHITGGGAALHGVPGRDAAEDAIIVPTSA